MANVFAVKSGNWSDTTVWNTGALPTSADDVYSNTFTVTIDTSPTVLSIRTTTATGVSAGGGFRFTNGTTVTCTGVGFQANAQEGQIVFDLNSPSSVNIVGTVLNGFNITGNGTVNINGFVQNSGINMASIIFSGASANGATLNITGNVLPNSSGLSQATIRYQNLGAVVNITGQVIAPLANQAIGEITSATAVLSVTGPVTARDNFPAVFVTSTSPTLYFSGPFICSTNGTHAVCAPKWRWTTATPINTYYEIRNFANTAIRPIYTADSVGGNPATSNVRSGTVYGPSNELTGTCAVPPAGSVALGVPVDNTTGTAALTTADIQAALTAQGLTTARAAYLDRLPNTSTTQEVADIIDAAI